MCDDKCPSGYRTLDDADEHGPALPDHTCPFKVEIHEDRETLCNCCSACVGQCGREV